MCSVTRPIVFTDIPQHMQACSIKGHLLHCYTFDAFSHPCCMRRESPSSATEKAWARAETPRERAERISLGFCAPRVCAIPVQAGHPSLQCSSPVSGNDFMDSWKPAMYRSPGSHGCKVEGLL